MEKKESAAPAHHLGVCEKVYNAFINRPSLIPLRRPRLTSGSNTQVADGHHHSDSRSSLPPTAAATDNQQKTAPAAAATLPKEVHTPQKEKLATKPPEPELPQLPKDQPKNTNILSSVTKLPTTTRPATIPEKQNVAQSAPPTAPAMTGRAPTSVLRVVTEKRNAAAPPVLAPSPPPPPAAAPGKSTPPPPPALLTAPAVRAMAPAPAPAVPPTALQVQAKAPPPPPPTAAPTTAAPAATPAVAAEQTATVAEKGKAAAPMRTVTNINEKSENFIRRARNSWRSSSAVGGTRKQS